ncbi:MAG: NAD(P)-binding domain-containing protein [Oscillospiraceae bacterium]|nr:NAD(P)-binding domain-containing protein [Oscillospiraceae bacterium]
MMNKRSFTVLGGDARMRYLVQALRASGHPVAVSCVAGLPDDAPPEALLPRADILILPLPTYDKDGTIVGTALSSEALLAMIPKGTRVFCGKPDAVLAAYPGVTDLLASPPLTVRNAALTAEGALAAAMTLLPTSVLGGQFLVVGAGRIGMALARRLRALGAEVTVSARRKEDFAKIESEALRSEQTGVYANGLAQYDCIFNTVPAKIFASEQLAKLSSDCLWLELASAPGGLAEEDRALLGKRFVPCPGLPGRCCPKTAGELILSEVFSILEEEVAL